MPAIRHLVVLMLENRSFDHILGFYTPAAGGQAVDGLTGQESNQFDPFAAGPGAPLGVQVTRTAGTDGFSTEPDPHHEHADAMEHIFCVANPPAGAAPNNKGFLASYAKVQVDGVTIPQDTAAKLMRCFDTARQLPAISALAQNFAVLDRWFSSLPGPTWPNRFFAHCATSGGLSGSPSDLASATSVAGPSAFRMPTIYEALSAVNVDWRIYFHDIPQALALERLHAHRSRFSRFATFIEDARAGTLPAYSFIEPGFFNLPFMAANDMHPSHDVRHGDQLVADVYNALRMGPAWSETALLVVWDEHGGFYDHAAPPTTVSPDGVTDGSGFDFRQLGVRVPCILASPLVPKGVVDSTVFDHSSIPATVKALFGTGAFLTRRDAQAATFHQLCGLGTARTDAPPSIAAAGGAPAPGAVPVTGNQRALIQLANALPAAGQNAGPGESPIAPEAVAASLGRVSDFLAR